MEHTYYTVPKRPTSTTKNGDKGGKSSELANDQKPKPKPKPKGH